MKVKGLLRVPLCKIGKETEQLRLGMALMVYNEDDILEDNIRYHARIGVDCFFIIDNGSTDKTADILNCLSSEFEIHILNMTQQSYQQSQWMTMLNQQAKKHGCDLVINNDADEFYIVKDGLRLKECLSISDSIVEVSRFNMLLTSNLDISGQSFWQSEWRVEHPIEYPELAQVDQENISISLAKISPKVITNPHGLTRVKGGNHRAKHRWGWLNARKESNIWVAHYPFRSYLRLELGVERRKLLLQNKARMGYHWKRWVKIYDKGELRQEFNRQVFPQKQLNQYESIGIVKHTLEPSKAIQITSRR